MENKTTHRAEDMHQHIAQCVASGKSVAQYCKEHNLNAATYYYWCKKLNTPKSVGGFIEVSNKHPAGSVEVSLPNGVRVCFDKLVPVCYLKELVCCI
jgi:transposase-like protein